MGGHMVTTSGPETGTFLQHRRRYGTGFSVSGAADLERISQSSRLYADEPDQFAATIYTAHVGSTLLTRFRSSPVYSERTTKHVGDTYTPFLQIGIVLEGSVQAQQSDRVAVVGPGEGACILLDRPFNSTNDFLDLLQVDVPAATVLGWGMDVANLHCRTWRLSSLARMCVRFFTDFVCDAPKGPAGTAGNLDAVVLGMSRILVEDCAARLGQPPLSPEDLLRARATAYIDQHFSEPGLEPKTLAEALGISRRYLYRLFEQGDQSVAGILRNRRLDRASLILTLPQLTPPSIRSVARLSGFRGEDQFTRCFRARFGVSPTQFQGFDESSVPTGSDDGKEELVGEEQQASS